MPRIAKNPIMEFTKEAKKVIQKENLKWDEDIRLLCKWDFGEIADPRIPVINMWLYLIEDACDRDNQPRLHVLIEALVNIIQEFSLTLKERINVDEWNYVSFYNAFILPCSTVLAEMPKNVIYARLAEIMAIVTSEYDTILEQVKFALIYNIGL